jgi:anti-sigma factor RsiW
MNKDCGDFYELLVDYADGELAGAEVEAVAQHLARCAACRASLQRLERSLALARAIWQEPLVVPRSSGSRRLKPVLAGTLAACAAALLLISGLLLLLRKSETGFNETASYATTGAVDDTDVELFLARHVQAARLAASANLLANTPAAAPYDEGALTYLASAYSDTDAGRQAAQRILSEEL